jgi:hypothetical protein
MRTGFLTIYSADTNEIYGEFADANWQIEDTDGGKNNLFTGTASEGTMETFRRLDTEGIDHVTYRFECDGARYSGSAQLLALEDNREPGQATVRTELSLPKPRASDAI